MSEVSPKDLLAEAVLDCAAAFILMANAQLDLENSYIDENLSEEAQVMFHKKLNNTTKSWYEANKKVISCVQSIPEANQALLKYIRKRREDGESRESADVSVSNSSSSSSQEVSGHGDGEVGHDISGSIEVPHVDDGLSRRTTEPDGTLSSVVGTSGESTDRDSERTSGITYTKRYLSNNTILRASLLCSVSKDSFMSPLSLASDLPLVIYRSPEAYEGEVVYKDENDRVFILEEVDNETI